MEEVITFLKLNPWLTYGPITSLLTFLALHTLVTAFRKPKDSFFSKKSSTRR